MNTEQKETTDPRKILDEPLQRTWKRVDELKGLCRVLAGIHDAEIAPNPEDIASVADLIGHHLEEVSDFLDDLEAASEALAGTAPKPKPRRKATVGRLSATA